MHPLDAVYSLFLSGMLANLTGTSFLVLLWSPPAFFHGNRSQGVWRAYCIDFVAHAAFEFGGTGLILDTDRMKSHFWVQSISDSNAHVAILHVVYFKPSTCLFMCVCVCV